jgi:hypothetical protein
MKSLAGSAANLAIGNCSGWNHVKDNIWHVVISLAVLGIVMWKIGGMLGGGLLQFMLTSANVTEWQSIARFIQRPSL